MIRTVVLFALAGSSSLLAQHHSMRREGSGTSWMPDAVTIPGQERSVAGFHVMLHGSLFALYDHQGGPRGANQFSSLSWAMLGVGRDLAGGRAWIRFMPSLDAATVGGCGAPQLLQTGGLCKGSAIADRQHQHELFKELAILYERPLIGALSLLLYGGPAGEPALGPVAHMHRPSAMDDPASPLGHHWQDATQTSFGVATVGLFTHRIRIEASRFNGFESDDFRWDIEVPELNSTSARLTVNPSDRWSMSAGYGKMSHFEQLPSITMRRLVASVMYGRPRHNGQWATTAIYGMIAHKGVSKSHSGLVESELVAGANTVLGRIEVVEKNAGDLRVTDLPIDHSAHHHGSAENMEFLVGAASLGYVRDLARGGGVTLGLGARGTVNAVPRTLAGPYGSRAPVGALLFARVRPARTHH